MAIDLTEVPKEAHTRIGGDDSFEATAGQHIVIETSPNGLDLMDYTVPAGHTATVSIIVVIKIYNE